MVRQKLREVSYTPGVFGNGGNVGFLGGWTGDGWWGRVVGCLNSLAVGAI